MGSVLELTRNVAWAGDYATEHGQVAKSIVGRIARTDTSPKQLGRLPAGATVTGIEYSGGTDSNAQTTATLDVGYADANGNELITAADVKGSGTGIHDAVPLTSDQADDHVITGVYTETGNASSTGGPWLVKIEFVTNAS